MKTFFKKNKKTEPEKEGLEIDWAACSRVAPSVVAFEGAHTEVGERVRRHLGIREFSRDNKAGWLDFMKSECASMTITVTPTNTEDIIAAVNRTDSVAGLKLERANTAEKTVMGNIEREQAQLVMEMLGDAKTPFLDVAFEGAIEADGVPEAKTAFTQLSAAARAKGIEIDPLVRGQKRAYLSGNPMSTTPDPYLTPRFVRSMPASTLAAAEPFDEAGLIEECGVDLGVDEQGRLVRVDMLSTSFEKSNMNGVATGKSGMGKSHLLSLIAASEYARGARVIWLDFEQESKFLCQNLCGQYLNCAGSGVTMSPLQYRAINFDYADDVDTDTEIVDVLRSTVSFLDGFFQLAFDVTTEDLPYLERGLSLAYARHGVFWDTPYEEIDFGDYPTFDEVAEVLTDLAKEEEDEYAAAVYRRLSAQAARGGEKGLFGNFWSGKTDVALDSDFIVFDLSAMTNAPDSVRNAQLYSVLSFVWSEVCRSRITGAPLRLIVDEAHLLFGGGTKTDGTERAKNPIAASLLSMIVRRARKYGAAVMVSTQSLKDFAHASVRDYTQAIFDNATYSFAFGCDDWKVAAEMMHIPNERAEELPNYRRGKCIFRAGSRMLELEVAEAKRLKAWVGNAGGK